MFARFFPPPPVPELANEPLTLVSALGGELGDIAHSEEDLQRATALATSEQAATFSPLLLRHTTCFGAQWSRVWAFLEGGSLRLFKDEAANAAYRTLKVKECECTVGERDECKTDHYCFRLRHASGVATFCAFNSKQFMLWLQALQTGGVKYEDPVTELGGVRSLFELRADMLSGEPRELSVYAGLVCLVVNAASK